MYVLSYGGDANLAGVSEVKNLQEALNLLAISIGQPGMTVTVDGAVGPQTITATINAVTVVGGSLDTATQIAIIAIATTSTAKQKELINKYASTIASAIKAYIAGKAVSNVVSPGSSPNKLVRAWEKAGIALNLFPDKRQIADKVSNATSFQTMPQGTIHAFDSSIGMYRVAQPLQVIAGKIATHFEVGTSAQAPAGSVEVSIDDYLAAIRGNLTSWYQTWWGKSLLGVGIAGGLVLFFKFLKNRTPKQFR